jgi:hypothetical protein
MTEGALVHRSVAGADPAAATPTAALQVDVLGIGLAGPGMADWSSAVALLRMPSAWAIAPTVVPPAARLPANERRRAGAIVRLSIAVADAACVHAGLDASTLATVFSASTGDTANCHALCEALAAPGRVVSPTRFTNSVHNASAGYWHIATASRAPSTSLCACDATFGAGLLEAASQCAASGQPVLLVCADTPYPEPLHAWRPLPEAFGLAFALAPSRSAMPALARLAIETTIASATPMPVSGLESLRRAIPAARGLPLLAAIARGGREDIVVDYLPELALRVSVAVEGPT